jgi:hypothetical protein
VDIVIVMMVANAAATSGQLHQKRYRNLVIVILIS